MGNKEKKMGFEVEEFIEIAEEPPSPEQIWQLISHCPTSAEVQLLFEENVHLKLMEKELLLILIQTYNKLQGEKQLFNNRLSNRLKIGYPLWDEGIKNLQTELESLKIKISKLEEISKIFIQNEVIKNQQSPPCFSDLITNKASNLFKAIVQAERETNIKLSVSKEYVKRLELGQFWHRRTHSCSGLQDLPGYQLSHPKVQL